MHRITLLSVMSMQLLLQIWVCFCQCKLHQLPQEMIVTSIWIISVVKHNHYCFLFQAEQGASDSDIEDPRRSRETLDTTDSLSHVHICETCSREASSIYYNRQGELGHYDCHKVHAPDSTRDGSMYFNYLQFANRPKSGIIANQSLTGSNMTYEPVEHNSIVNKDKKDNSKKLKPPKPPKPRKPQTKITENTNNKNTMDSNEGCRNYVFSCCRKSSSLKSTTGHKTNEKYQKCLDDVTHDSSPYHDRPPSPETTPAILNNNRARKASEWSRVKRLLFLVGILLGILVALDGIVVGFIVLAPHRNKGSFVIIRIETKFCIFNTSL